MTATSCRRGFGLVAAFATACALLWATPSGVVAVNTVPQDEVLGDIGDVVLIGSDGRALANGDGTTRFFVRLPEAATCPGDSANDQWRANSFLVPVSDDPLELVFGSSGPEPPWTSGRYPLFANDTNLPIVFSLLRRNEAPGSPGLIETIPETSLGVQADNQFPGGSYRVGIACTYFAQTTQYWDAEIEISAASEGDPGALTWTLKSGLPSPADSTSGSGSGVWLVALLAALFIAVAMIVFRRRSGAVLAPVLKEQS